MAAILSGLAMGVLFGTGLLISGMTNPANVKGFLDVFGEWRPQLMAVLGVGIMVASLIFFTARKIGHPLLEPVFHWPASTKIDRPLILGAAVFGAGWALAGFCPGPALVAAGALNPLALVFVAAMLAGGWVQRVTGR